MDGWPRSKIPGDELRWVRNRLIANMKMKADEGERDANEKFSNLPRRTQRDEQEHNRAIADAHELRNNADKIQMIKKHTKVRDLRPVGGEPMIIGLPKGIRPVRKRSAQRMVFGINSIEVTVDYTERPRIVIDDKDALDRTDIHIDKADIPSTPHRGFKEDRIFEG